MNIRRVSVIGSGIMGQGIAQACAVGGFDVCMFDVDPALAANALRNIGANLSQSVSKGRITGPDMKSALSRLETVRMLNDLHADLIIEAIVERLEPKQELLATVEANNHASILATNTSTFPVARVSAKLKNPSNCVGLHFFNPANVMKLVEVISGPSTSAGVYQAAVQFVKAIGKTPVLANDSPGFIVNRVARSFYLESLKLLEEQCASKEAIDSLAKATGFRMGPFELMDLIGLDTNLAVTESLYEAFGRPEKFKPSQTQADLVNAKQYGIKTGKGFYEYPR